MSSVQIKLNDDLLALLQKVAEEGINHAMEGLSQMVGQELFMLILTCEKAMEMVDLLMGDKPGSCRELDGIGRSALAEMGNLSGTFFLNTIANLTGLESRPSPPVVMMDMAGAILNVIVATTAENLERVVMILTSITLENREVEANFWYIPDPNAMDELAKKAGKEK